MHFFNELRSLEICGEDKAFGKKLKAHFKIID
ncbi:hypothetical protein ZONE111904_12165 [Zobellia nedashkovskayae]